MSEEQKKPTQKAITGKIGEDAAADFIERKGYRILERNQRYGHHELDIIAVTGHNLVFIEVKTRKSRVNDANSRFGTPSSAVTYEKQRNLIDAARKYIKEKQIYLVPRFDVIEVYVKNGTADAVTIEKINHIENAFIS